MFPTVNYIGNKRKLSKWIIDRIPSGVKTVTDAFAGGNSISYLLKEDGYSVVSNDVLYSSFVISKALVENDDVVLNADAIYRADSFKITQGQLNEYKWLTDTLYFPKEVHELARLVTYAKEKLTGYKYYMFLSLLRRAMIRKLPYSRMNINWKNIVKLRNEAYSYKKYGRKRAYHNKSFIYHMMNNLNDYNLGVFKGKRNAKSEQMDIIELLKKYPKRDLLYLDPPYPGTMNNYDGFYDKFDEMFGRKIHHMNLTNKSTFLDNMNEILKCSENYKYVMISFNNSIKPNYMKLLKLLKAFGTVTVFSHKHNYQVSGSVTKNKNVEKLAIIKMNK